eukprot:1159980-Pelagomonas_calceolata.AAC.2
MQQEVIINTVSSANDYAAQMALLRPNGSLCIDMNEMLEFAAQAGVAPKCETMPLSKVNEAFEKVKNNQVGHLRQSASRCVRNGKVQQCVLITALCAISINGITVQDAFAKFMVAKL